MTSAVVTSQFIVRADVVRALADAHQITVDAVAEAERIKAAAYAQRNVILEEARQLGLKEGIAEAAAIAAGAAAAVDAFWRQHESEVAEVAFAIAYRIVSSLPAQEMMARIASEAIAEYGASVALTLRAAPEAAAYLRADLDNRGAGRVIVVADAAAAPDECTLSDGHRRSNLGVRAQFRAMMDDLDAKSAKAESLG